MHPYMNAVSVASCDKRALDYLNVNQSYCLIEPRKQKEEDGKIEKPEDCLRLPAMRRATASMDGQVP